MPTGVAERRDLTITVEVTGQVEPVRVVEVKSRASGEVLRVHAETGDLVEAGTVLVEIDPRDVQNALEQAEADLASAEVRARIAKAQAARVRTLFAEGVVAQQEVDAAEEAAASAEAAVLRARTNLELARERRRDVIIRAPTTGTVLSRRVEPGQIIVSATGNVSGGTTLFLMADLSRMRVRANVAETDLGRIRPGMPAKLTVEAYPGRTFWAAVEKIEPQAVVEQNVTLFPVLLELENSERLLLPGMTAEVALEVAHHPNALVVPNAAVVGARDLAAAARAVGVDVESARQVLRAGPSPDGRRPPEDTLAEKAPGASAAEGPSETCRDLFRKLRESGGPRGLSEREQELFRQCRDQLRARGGFRLGRGRPTEPPVSEQLPERRAGLVFLVQDGVVQPKRVTFGLSDWEYTEVLEGLQEGDRVALVTVAQLLVQQKQAEERFRQRTSTFSGSPTATSSRRGP
jgi:HlyD family secretion protein